MRTVICVPTKKSPDNPGRVEARSLIHSSRYRVQEFQKAQKYIPGAKSGLMQCSKNELFDRRRRLTPRRARAP